MNDQPTPQGSEGQTPSGGPPPLRESVSSAGERIQVIIEAAEKAAAGIIEDADAQARRYIDTSRQRADVLADERVRVMSDLTDTLIRQAEMVRRQSDELLALDSARGSSQTTLDRTFVRYGGAAASPAPTQDQPPAQAPRVPHLQPVESSARACRPWRHPRRSRPPDATPESPTPAPQQSPAQDSAPAARRRRGCATTAIRRTGQGCSLPRWR
jgi:hypothetical protein